MVGGEGVTETVFISYSKSDKFFAELLENKLTKESISVWRDDSSLSAGEEWRQSIDIGIGHSKIMIVALSQASCASHYVTYEWATALALKKTIIPVLLEKCERHPKLEPLQYVDFTRHNNGTWQTLMYRIKELWADDESSSISDGFEISEKEEITPEENFLVDKIAGYMNGKGFRMISLDRIKILFGDTLSDSYLEALIEKHPRLLPAKLSKGRKGLALL